jgi:hypothetical protein
MRPSEQSSLVFATGLAMSLLGHSLVAVGLWRLGPAAAQGNSSRWERSEVTLVPDEVDPPAPSEEAEIQPPPRELRLGISGGDRTTLTWLGFDEATDHSARQGLIEQSPMSLNPVQSPNRGSITPPLLVDRVPAAAEPQAPDLAPLTETSLIAAGPVVPAQPVSVAAEPFQPDPAAEPELVENQEAIDPEFAKSFAVQISQAAEAARAATERVSEALNQLLETRRSESPPALAPPASAGQASSSSAPPLSAAAAASQPAAPPQAESGGAAGIKSDREAIAVAVKNAPTVRPGKVLAAEGLEILTRQPRFAITTQLLRKPRNPTVSVTFGRDGLVQRAVFVSDGRGTYNTGSNEIDQPLLNAIYSWTARGEALEELSGEDPEAGITIMFTILLGG